MIISIGSGKGGTGKTTVSTGLAIALAREGNAVRFLDCDVEEPNANIFIKAAIRETRSVEVMVPEIDEGLCTHCGECADFCRFKALVVYPDKVLRFPEMCHSCNGCVIVCPEGAVKAVRREIGTIEMGDVGNIRFAQGLMNIGEARATPIIAKLQSLIDPSVTTILDAPPGTSCPFVETVKRSDVCVLVTEPTPFGLNDLKLAVEVTETLGIPRGIIINRSDVGDDRVENYCGEEGIDVLMRIPHDRAIAEACSKGDALVDARPEFEDEFLKLNGKLSKMAKGKG
jgi:MinD superfamily P-loop ATPase